MESWLPYMLTLAAGLAIGILVARFALGRSSGRGSGAIDKNAGKLIQRLYDESPRFFTSIKDDLTRPGFAEVREFAIIASSDVTFVSEELRFVYYEDEVPNLQNLAKTLEDHGFVDDVTSGRTPIFRMKENFVRALDSL